MFKQQIRTKKKFQLQTSCSSALETISSIIHFSNRSLLLVTRELCRWKSDTIRYCRCCWIEMYPSILHESSWRSKTVLVVGCLREFVMHCFALGVMLLIAFLLQDVGIGTWQLNYRCHRSWWENSSKPQVQHIRDVTGCTEFKLKNKSDFRKHSNRNYTILYHLALFIF